MKQLRPTEHQSQAALIEWWRLAGLGPERALFAIPNGGWLHSEIKDGKRVCKAAAKLRREGLRPGIPDLFLAIPSRGLHGLFIEMKSADGAVSPEQREMLVSLTERGYGALVCRSFDQAADVITKYLKG